MRDQDQLDRARPDYSTMSFDQLMALEVGKSAEVFVPFPVNDCDYPCYIQS